MNKYRISDALKIAFKSFISNIHTCIPGTIESYDANKKKVNVKPSIKKKLNNEIISYPVITEVPVIFPSTNNSIICFPLSKGDGGLILFSEVALENYLSSNGQEVDPGDDRKFALSDAIFIPGLFPFASPGKIGNGNSLEIKTNKVIEIDGDTIKLNGESKSLVTHEELNTALQSFVADLNTKLTAALLPVPFTWPGTSINISDSKTTTIKTGG